MAEAPILSPEEVDALAAEYVLGTLPPEERRDFIRRMAREAEAAHAASQWQERLAPLVLAIEPVAPPPALLGRIEAAIADAPAAAARPRAANDNASRWRLAAIAAALVAIVTSGLAWRGPATVAGSSPAARLPVEAAAFRPGTSIAALSEKGQTPGLFVTYDKASGKLRVVPIGLTEDEKHSFELWLIEGKSAPKPMGLIDARKGIERGAKLDPAHATTFAVSVEPVGGSPTGAPTGPVVYSGALVRLPVES